MDRLRKAIAVRGRRTDDQSSGFRTGHARQRTTADTAGRIDALFPSSKRIPCQPAYARTGLAAAMNRQLAVTGTYAFGDVLVDAKAHTVHRGQHACVLEPKAFHVLLFLLCHPGEAVTKDALLDNVWGHRAVTPNVLSRAIAQIRHALGDAARNPRYIETVPTYGYRFIAPLRCVACPGAAADCPTFRLHTDVGQRMVLLEEMQSLLGMQGLQEKYPALTQHFNDLAALFGDKPSGMVLYELALEYGLEKLNSLELDLPWRHKNDAGQDAGDSGDNGKNGVKPS
jgi:DNA-binding winged helix-turn-helix (wHTH) protein